MNNHRVSSIKNIRTIKALRGDELKIDLGKEINGVLTAWMKKDPNSDTYRSFEFTDQRYLVLSPDKTKDYYDVGGELIESVEGKWYFDVEFKESEEATESKTIYTGTIIFYNDITGDVGYEITDYETAPYAPVIHTHEISDINGLQSTIDDINLAISNLQNGLAVSVNTYPEVPLETGVYQVSNFTSNTEATSYEDSSKFEFVSSNITVHRNQVIDDGRGYIGFVDHIFLYQYFIGSIKIDVYGTTAIYADMNLNEEFLPDNHHMRLDNSFNDHIAKISFTIREDDFIKEGLIKMPYDLYKFIKESHVFINEKKTPVEFVYLSDSTIPSVTAAIKGLDGSMSKQKGIGAEVRMILKYNDSTNPVSMYTPVHKDLSEISLRNAITYDISLSHSNKMKLWFSEFWSNNLSGLPSTVFGYEIPNLSARLSTKIYRLDAMLNNDADLLYAALGSSGSNLSKNDEDDRIFKISALGSNDPIRLDITEAEDDFRNDLVLVSSREESDNDGSDPEGTAYGFGVEFNEPTRIADLIAIGLTPDIDTHQQSPATAIVASKFKYLRVETGAPWGLIREACRSTASNAGSYNIYRGFGQIDTAAAKTYIETNIDTWTGVNTTELAEYYDAISPYNTDVKLSEKTNKTPITKGDYIGQKAYISGRVGTTVNPTTGVLKFNEFWSDSGDIDYDAGTGYFTFSKAGVYKINFNGLVALSPLRLQILKNTTTNSNSANFGHAYCVTNYNGVNLMSTIGIEAGDYIVFKIASGTLYNQTNDRYNEFSIERIS